VTPKRFGLYELVALDEDGPLTTTTTTLIASFIKSNRRGAAFLRASGRPDTGFMLATDDDAVVFGVADGDSFPRRRASLEEGLEAARLFLHDR
jgi:hypothetical protein